MTENLNNPETSHARFIIIEVKEEAIEMEEEMSNDTQETSLSDEANIKKSSDDNNEENTSSTLEMVEKQIENENSDIFKDIQQEPKCDNDFINDNQNRSKSDDIISEIKEKMDTYDGDELKIAIYQFLNGSDLETTKGKGNEKHCITESSPFIQLTEDKDTPYSCGVCGKEFTSVGGLVIHLRIHTGDQPYVCSECKKGFTNRANLQKHLRIHNNDRPYKCDVCGAKFTLNQNMQTHRLTHTGEKPHKCNVCGKSFSRAHHVKRHMITHSSKPEKKYECKMCTKSFSRKENLQAHSKTHGKVVHECAVCGQHLDGAGRLKYHMKRKHPEEGKSLKFSNVNKNLETLTENDSSSVESFIKAEKVELDIEEN